jgi:hypothetical protein
MNDLIFITAYCPTLEQEVSLERCIDSILKCGFHVALISHTHIPIHIQKKCNYYVYDYKNDISDNDSLMGFSYFKHGNFEIVSKYFSKYFYGFAIYRMFAIASQIAINFGYKRLYHIEYDCELLDTEILFEHKRLLDEYDSVVYTNDGKEGGFLFGSLKSFKVESLPEKFKSYDREFITEEMIKLNSTYLEFLTKKLFMNSGKVLFKNEVELSEDKFKKGIRFYNRNLHYTLFYDKTKSSLNIFYKSLKDHSEKIKVIVNEDKIVTINVEPNSWYIKNLGEFDKINNIRIDNNKHIMFETSFDEDIRSKYKLDSYIVYHEKNN